MAGGALDGQKCAEFGVTLSELRELMEFRGNDAYQRIQTQYSGALELCRRLYTSPTEGRSTDTPQHTRPSLLSVTINQE